MRVEITANIKGLSEDLKNEKAALDKKINYALLQVGVEMQTDLQNILQSDWYDRYKPVTYQRRTDNPSLGTPLGSDNNFEKYVVRQSLEFTFEPTGTHANPLWTERSGDSLIAWIQREHNYVDEDGEVVRMIPSRPFWNNFLDTQMDGGIMEKFIKAMSPNYIVHEDGTDDLSDLANYYLPEDIVVHTL